MKKTLLLFLLLPFLGFAQQLSGDIVISSANTDANFRTLALAIDQIYARGVSGPVRFLLDEDQNLTSLLTINVIPNTSATNTFTIKPNTGKNITITTTMASPSTGIPAVIRFNGANNVIIDGSNSTANTKNLTLINTDNLGYTARSVIWIASNGSTGSTNITVKNTNLRFANRNDGSTLLTGVYSGGNGLGTNNSLGGNANNGANSNISIINNETFNIKDGVNINGNASASPTGWKIQGNKIGTTTVAEKPIRAIYISNAANYEISGNTLSGIRNTVNDGNDCAAIVLLGNSTGSISGNYINDIVNTQHNNAKYSAGILVKTSGTTNINNNIISNVYNTTADSNNYNYYNRAHSIFIYSGSATNVYYNTLIASGAPTGTTSASCLYTEGGSGINIKNNIFVNLQSNEQYAIFLNGGTVSQISNNDYYVNSSTNKFLNRISGTLYAATTAGTVPANWNSAVGDSASQTFLPTFVTPGTDYHIQDVTVNNNLTGVAIAGITTDIDGDTRVKPYMGADEVVKCVPAGDQTSFGSESWIGYVYSFTGNTAPNPTYNTLPTGTTYLGTVTETTRNFDRNVADGAVNGATRNFCDTAPTDRFFVRYKMTANLTEAGQYNFMLGSDDGIRLYIDGIKVFERWNQHSYTVDAFLQTLSAGSHQFILEYFELDGSSRAAISFGAIKGDQALPYGINSWNVYGLTKNDLNLSNTVYAGYYVDSNVNVDSRNYWTTDKSPSSATNWQGAPLPNDNFTVSYRRQGFPCGTYRIELANSDDATQIYMNESATPLFTQNGYTNTAAYINGGATYVLNSTSKIEVRLREDGGNANVAVNFVRVLTPYTGSETVNSNTSIVISSPTVTLGSDIQVCSCTVNSGSTFNVPSDRTLTVDEDINVLGTGKLAILSGGSLLQTSTSKTMYTGNATTSFEVQRTTNVRRYDATYWSMPVTNPSFTMASLSPNTLLDKYYWYDPNSTWTVSLNGTMPMEVGKGYNIRAPQPFDANTATPFTGIFKGIPNNGNIAPVVVANKFNLVGNPYPSAISATALINANTNLGTLYFWTHNSSPVLNPADGKYYYNNADFAAFNLTGFTGTSSGATLNGQPFEGYIAAGQGFLAKPKTGTLTFNNTMRIGNKNKQFYKTTESGEIERNRLWLNLSNDLGAFKQILVGYIEGATNSFDINYDATTLGSNSSADFYSINESNNMTIQGRALPFDNQDIVPMGYKSATAGEYTIAIDHADGFFDTQEVYLEDLVTGKIVSLRSENYKFTTEVGTFTNRFNLRYTSKTLGTGDFENAENTVLVSVRSKIVKVTATKENIKDVQIYNIGGQLVYNNNKVDSNELQISNLPSGNQVLLVKVVLENGSEVSKKIIFN
ncbi:T9SS sorting signal type C domain-containing protein [Flavobacterium johnsoniae]|uniref:T9SS sorting signal type C domain-containing protein n=1 Tax=Flavobacterium johnsoniae TaxID=986 RepID=UPI0025B139B4|nr:T9SS sorting signal type C domain-containing protein [Flavobacterium johnsoniae]WJS95579.1 T9SS sorting signal type C domain-containing protein [Flavobacterium johnsoniae]